MSNPDVATNGSYAVVAKAIDALTCEVKNLSTMFTEFRIQYEIRHADVANQATAAHARLDALEKIVSQDTVNIDKLEEMIRPITIQAKIIAWVAGVMGVSIIGLIWGILTHSVSLTMLP